jgi:tetratricopeptide (TPR) repeat protein
MLDKTIVVIVGDHGEAFGEHTEFGHGIFCYEEVLKVPLIIHNRGMFKKHRLVKNRVSLVDIFPTIVELYGEKVPASVQGKSFKHLLTGKKEADERLIYFESMYGKEENNWAPLTGLIDGSLKYIALPQPELYDLGKDRKEKTNIIGRNPRISRQYDEKLKRFLSLHSFSNNGAKRSLSREDTAHLESLGYISRGAGKSASVIDPKTGVVLDIKLKELNKKISVGQYESSEKELKVLIAADTKLRHPMLYILLDKIYLAQKNRPASLQNLQAGLQLFPNSDELNYRFLTELTIDREYQKAIDYAKKILVKNPYFTRAYAILGDIYVELLDYRNAVNNFREAARLEPENINLNLKYADLLIKIKEFDLVLPIYERLSNKEEFSRNHDFLFWFAKFHFSYGDKHRAEELLRQAIDIQPHGNYYFYYALVLSKNSRYKEAVRNLEIAMEKYPHQLTERQKQDALKAIPAWTKKAENSN